MDLSTVHPLNCLLTLNNGYPSEPNPGGKSPDGPPRDGDGNPLQSDDTPADAASDIYEAGTDTTSTLKKSYTFPGCTDKLGGLASAMALQQLPPFTEPTCDMDKASDVPYNIFSSSSGRIYDKFCASLTLNNTNGLLIQSDLTWTFDASGNKTPNPTSFATRSLPFKRKSSSRVLGKRTSPPSPSPYTNVRFLLSWKPGDYTANLCNRCCADAYYEISQSSCGHADNAQNLLTDSSMIDVGCGKYSVEVVST